MFLISGHEAILSLSACGAILGLLISLSKPSLTSLPTISELTKDNLIRMVFLYWLLYCVAEGLEKFISVEAIALIAILRLIAMISYVLTFCCLLSLPLYHLDIRHHHHGPSRLG